MPGKKRRTKGSGSIFKRDKYYYFKYIPEGEDKPVIKSLRTSNKAKAEEKAAELVDNTVAIKQTTDFYEKVAETKKLINSEQLTLEKALENYKKDLDLEDLQYDTKNRHFRRAEVFIEFVNETYPAIKYLWEITDDIAINFSKHLKSKNLTSNTYNSNIFSLHKFYENFKKELGVSDNPFRSNKNDKNIKRKRIMTVQKAGFAEKEVRTILNSFNDIEIRDKAEYRLLFILGAYTGARLKDCALMKWESINLKSNIITYTPFKTSRFGTIAIVPVLPELKSELGLLENNSEYILPAIAARYNNNRKYVNTDIKKILKHNKFDESNTDISTKRVKTAVKYGFHSMRYFFVTQCALKRIPLKLVKEAVGHSDDIMTEYYTVLSNLDRQKAFGLTRDTPIIEQITKLLPLAKHDTLKEILGLLKLDANLIKKAEIPGEKIITMNKVEY